MVRSLAAAGHRPSFTTIIQADHKEAEGLARELVVKVSLLAINFFRVLSLFHEQ